MAERKIVILSADAGLGHRRAAEAIRVALEETVPEACDVEIITPLDDKRVPAVLRDSQSDYDTMIRNAPKLYKLGYEASDTATVGAVFDGALIIMLFEVMRDMVRKHKPDVIVSTYPLYQAPLGAVFQLTQHRAPLFTVITDLATVHTVWFHRATDLCLVPTERVRDLALKHHLPEERVLVTGLPVHPRIAGVGEDKRALRERLDWPTDLTTLLVVGSRRVSRLPEMLRAVNHSGLPLHLVLVAGGDDELYETFKATTWHVRAHVYNFVEEMPAFMHAADAIVTKAGGLIVSESLACGLPMLLVNALPGQEQGNADLVVEGGAGDLTQEPIALLETLFHWLEDDGALLRSRAARAQELGRPRAAFRIAELVWKAAQGELPTRQSLRLSRQGRDRRSLVAMLRRNQVPWSEE